MIAKQRTILVTGITGKQGGAVADHLVKKGFAVRGLTRNTESPQAEQLKERNVQLVRGDMDDRDSLTSAMQGVHGVFAVQDPWTAGVSAEVRFGKNLADIAKQTGVAHFVQSSVAAADQSTGIPHFDSKYDIELHIRQLDLPCTIVRPVFFMENWDMPMLRDAIDNGMLPQPLSPQTSLQQVAVDDIGEFVAMAFADPEKWIGRDFDLAGDELTMLETVETFSRVLNKPVKYVQVPWDEFQDAVGEEMTIMYRWFEDVGYSVNISACRAELPNLKTLEHFLRARSSRAAAPTS